MVILPGPEEAIRREIRDARAKDPLVTVVALQELLEKRLKRTFTQKYISKLARKVDKEMLVTADRAKLNERLTLTRETYRMARERLMDIVYWDQGKHDGERPPSNRDVIEAAKNLVMLDLAVLNAEVAAGVYQTQADAAVKALAYAPLPEDRRLVVIDAFVRWGYIPKAQAEMIVPALPAHGGTAA
jgi:hypothetical protein